MSTSSSTSPQMEEAVVKTTTNAVPRKRRRRTAATGAAEDCFTCRKRQVRCDRRRPYCTQCLDIGKDCSGYRTTLTWNVGVASRGKLRGLSLPIVNSTAKAASSVDVNKDQTSPVAAKMSTSPCRSPEHDIKPKVEETYDASYQFSSELSPPIFSPVDYNATSPIPIPGSRNGWSMPNFNDQVDAFSTLPGKGLRLQIRPNPLRRVHTTATASYEEAVYSTPSAGSVSGLSDYDYPSPRELPATPEDYSIPEPYVGSYGDSFPCSSDHIQSPDAYTFMEAPRSFPIPSSYIPTSMGSMPHMHMSYNMMPSTSAPHSFTEILQCNNFSPVGSMGQQTPVPQKPDQEYFSDGFSDFSTSIPSGWSANMQQPLAHLNPRMRAMLEYQ